MKKRLLAFALITILAAIAGIYIFIPARLTVTNNVVVNATLNSTGRIIIDSSKWKSWWPDKSSPELIFNGYRYSPSKGVFNAVEVNIHNNKQHIESRITVMPLNKDSVLLEWRSDYESGNSPLARIDSYNKASDLKNDMRHLLSQLKTFLEKTENIYGTPVIKTKVKDTLLIVTIETLPNIPSTEQVYHMIDRLKAHAKKENVPETGYPMLHYLQTGDARFETMVALPVGRAPKEYGGVSIRRMVPGNILITEIKGGPWTIRQSFRQLQNYIGDHRIVSPAKPFESLVTDRRNEADTTKWTTKIYYPIF